MKSFFLNPAFLGNLGRDQDVESYVSRVLASGGTIDTRTADLVTVFVKGLKFDGLWDKTKEVGLFAGVGSITSAMVKIKYPVGAASSLTNVGFNSDDYVPFGTTCGLQNTGSPAYELSEAKYLNTGTPNSLVNTASNFVCVHVTEFFYPFNYSEFYFGRTGSGAALGIDARHTNDGGRANAFGGDVSQPASALNSDALGTYILSRRSAADLRLFKNGVEIAQNLNATSAGARMFTSSSETAILFGIRQPNGAAPVSTSSRRLAFYAWGEGLTESEVVQFNAHVSDLLTAISAYSLESVVATLQYGTRQVWNRCLRHFSGTEERFWAASDSLYPDMWIADLEIALQSRPEMVTASELAYILSAFYEERDGLDIPLSINSSGDATYYTAGTGVGAIRNQPCGMYGFIALHRLRINKGSDISLFNAHKTVLKDSMFSIPRLGAYVWVDPVGDGWIPWGFEDAADKRGRDLFGTICYRRAAANLAHLFGLAGDTADAAIFNAEVAAIDSAIHGDSYLWNSAGMFNAADVRNVQIDITGSAFAVWAGIASPAQASAISDWLDANFSSIVHPNGYVKQTPVYWAVSHNDQIGRGMGNYIDGYWSHGLLWVCTALAVNHPDRAVLLSTTVSAGMLTNLIPEWFGATATGPYNLLVGCQGAYAWARDHADLFS